jgi:hypothetical protein
MTEPKTEIGERDRLAALLLPIIVRHGCVHVDGVDTVARAIASDAIAAGVTLVIGPDGVGVATGTELPRWQPGAPIRTEQIEAAARALWTMGNARIGERPWGSVAAHYIAEATVALEAAAATAPLGERNTPQTEGIPDGEREPLTVTNEEFMGNPGEWMGKVAIGHTLNIRNADGLIALRFIGSVDDDSEDFPGSPLETRTDP